MREEEKALQAATEREARLNEAKLSLATSVLREQQQQQSLRKQQLLWEWECGCTRLVQGTEEAWLACGERKQGRIGILSVAQGHSMDVPPIIVREREGVRE